MSSSDPQFLPVEALPAETVLVRARLQSVLELFEPGELGVLKFCSKQRVLPNIDSHQNCTRAAHIAGSLKYGAHSENSHSSGRSHSSLGSHS